jgi:hypothetical protein
MSRALRSNGYDDAVKELKGLGVDLNAVKEGRGTGNIRMYSASIRLFDLFYPNAACLLPQGVMRNVNLLKLHKEDSNG